MREQWDADVHFFKVRKYAVDYDGDNNADLFNSKSDAIGSIANYLQIHRLQAPQAISSNDVI